MKHSSSRRFLHPFLIRRGEDLADARVRRRVKIDREQAHAWMREQQRIAQRHEEEDGHPFSMVPPRH